MPAKPRTIFLLVFAAMCGLFIFLSTDDRTGEQNALRKHDAPATAQSPAHSDPSGEALSSKFRQRPPAAKVSIAQTQARLETTIPGRVEFPEQTVLERIDAINRWIEDSGIPPDELHIIVKPDSAERLLAKDIRCQEFSNSNLSPSMLLGILFDRSALRYRVIPGGLEMVYMKPP